MSTHCPLPWNHLATHPQGETSLCCRVDYVDGRGMAFNRKQDGGRKFGNLNRDSLEDIINSDSFKDARLKMLAGEKPLACMGCFKDEERGLVSKRMRETEIFKMSIDELKSKTSATGEIDLNLEYAELRLGNLCNLKCRTCNPNSSSKWAAEYETMQSKLDFVRKFPISGDFQWAEKEDFWNNFLAHSDNLKMLFINGGEPTLIKQHWIFLQKLIDLGFSRNIDIKYNINMTYLPEKAFEIWKQFKSVMVGASIDDLPERNSYIRAGAEWEKIFSNLESIRDAGFGIAVEQTVSIYNIFYLDEMENFCKKNRVGHGLNFVYDPEFLAVYCIPDRVKARILAKLSNGISGHLFAEIAAQLTAKEDLVLWEKFRTYTRYLDESRNENFENIFPDYSGLLASEGYL